MKDHSWRINGICAKILFPLFQDSLSNYAVVKIKKAWNLSKNSRTRPYLPSYHIDYLFHHFYNEIVDGEKSAIVIFLTPSVDKCFDMINTNIFEKG
jgi:hypothetical protein